MYLAHAQAVMKAKWAARATREALNAKTKLPPEKRKPISRARWRDALRNANDGKVLLTPHAIKKFWSLVTKTEGCWLWTGPKSAHGYGNFGYSYMQIMAHRYAWITRNGNIPSRQEFGLLHVHHRCKTKACVRPDHLQLVAPKQHVELHKKL